MRIQEGVTLSTITIIIAVNAIVEAIVIVDIVSSYYHSKFFAMTKACKMVVIKN